MLRFVFAGATALLLIGAALPAGAGVVDNTSLAPPGVYFGSGNSNSGFTVATENGIELGLSAITRYIGPITPTGNVYTVPTGETSKPGKTGSIWGVDFSIDLGSSGRHFGDNSFTVSWSLVDAVNSPSGGSFDPTLIGDNATNGNTGIQNSETLSFASIRDAFLDPSFDESIADTYTFTLTVKDLAGDVLDTDTIVVDAVPEPASMALLGTALLGFGGIGWRRRRKA